MGVAQWMRVLDTVGGLIQMSTRFRRPPEADLQAPAGAGGPLGQLETRLAGVMVAALKEAFDRDRARMDLERTQMEAERERAEAALGAELRRQAAERALGQLRMIAVMAFGLLMVSAALGVWLPGMRTTGPRVLMGTGWVLRHRRAGNGLRRMAAGLGLDRRTAAVARSGGASSVPSVPRRRRLPGCFSALWR